MKKKLSTLFLALAILTTFSMPKRAEAGLMVTGAGIMSSGNTALGITFIGLGMIVLGALAGNGVLIVLDQDNGETSPLFPVVSAQFPFLMDQPAVVQSIASTLETQVRALDLAALGSNSVEVKLNDAEIGAILDQAIVTDAQALEIATYLK